MNDLAGELDRVSRAEHVATRAVTVLDSSFEHVDELDPRMLEQREDLAVLVQRDEHGLESFVRTSHVPEELILVADPGAVTGNHDSLSRSHYQSIVFLFEAAEQSRQRDGDR